VSQQSVLAFRRPSRSGGRDHVITVDRLSLRPLGCTCQAFAHRRLCWAVARVVAEELPEHASRRLAHARAVYERVQRRRAVALEYLAAEAQTVSRGRAA
jgi:hypothetical protein